MNTFVIGASGGIGGAIVRRFLVEGHTVYAGIRAIDARCDNAVERLRTFADGIAPGRLQVVEVDLTRDDTLSAAFQQIEKGLDGAPLDVIVNAAGQYFGGVSEAFTARQFAELIDVNVIGAHRLYRAALPLLKEQGAGSLLTVTDGLSQMVMPEASLYLASKHAQETLIEGYAYELAPLGIESLLVQAGPCNTNMRCAAQRPADKERLTSYERSSEISSDVHRHWFEQGEKTSSACSPAQVAEAIIRLLMKPFGTRPVRTSAVGEQGAFFDDLSQQKIHLQKTFLSRLGGEELLRISQG